MSEKMMVSARITVGLDLGDRFSQLYFSDLAGVPMSIGIWSIGTVIPGILVLVVAAAWGYGVELQQDRDLVV